LSCFAAPILKIELKRQPVVFGDIALDTQPEVVGVLRGRSLKEVVVDDAGQVGQRDVLEKSLRDGVDARARYGITRKGEPS